MVITMVITTATTPTTDAMVAALMLLTVSGVSVNATEAWRRDMVDVNRIGVTNKEDQQTLILLLSAWTAPAARGWT